MNLLRQTIACVGLLTLAALATGADDARLEENRKRWSSLTETERARIRSIARNLRPEQVEEYRGRLARLRGLPDADRTRVARNFDRFRNMGAARRMAVARALERYRSLPAKQRDEMRRRFRAGRLGDRRGNGREARRPVPRRTAEEVRRRLRERQERQEDARRRQGHSSPRRR